MSIDPARANDHEEAFALLPWWINGTLTPPELALVERHVPGCDECRAEAQLQRRLHDALCREKSNLEYAPQPAFDRLWSRIEELERDVPRTVSAPDDVATDEPTRAAAVPTRWLLAASLALAFGAGVLATSLRQWPESPSPPEFHTVTTIADSGHQGPYLRAVFAPATTIDELTRMTRGARLTIVAGPTEAGVYTLALDSSAAGSIDAALARLRDDPRVRFAEPAPVVGGAE